MKKRRILGVMLSMCMLVSGLSINPLPAKAETTTEETNIALSTNGTTVDTSHLSNWAETTGAATYSKEHLIDGKNATNTGFFMSDAQESYENEAISVTLSFNSTYRIRALQLTPAFSWKYEGGFPDTFKIEANTQDGWVTVVEQSGCTISSFRRFRYEFAQVDCSQLRLVTSKNGAIDNGEKPATYGLRLGEFEVYGALTPDLSNVALSTNGTTVDTSHLNTWAEGLTVETYKKARLNDGKGSKGTNSGFFMSANLAAAGNENTPISVTLKFNKAYQISKIRLEPAYMWSNCQGGFPDAFTVSVYTAEGWKEVVSDSGCGQQDSWKSYIFQEIDCTAVRLTTSKNSYVEGGTTNYGLRLGEFEVYGAESSEDIVVLPDAASYAAVQKQGTPFASTSRELGDVALNKLNDDDYKTVYWYKYYSSEFFSNPEGSQYAGVMFDKAYGFDSVTVATYGKCMPEDFHISVYNGSKWVDVVTENNYTPSTQEHGEFTFSFDEICGSAVRITADKMRQITSGSQAGYGLQITELIIHGAATTAAMDTPSVELFNVANGMTVTAGSVVDWGAPAFGSDLNNLVDNNSNTNYSSNWLSLPENYEWVQITFDAPVCAHYADFSVWANDGNSPKRFPKDFEIQAYTGTEWKTVVSESGYDITKETYAGGSTLGRSSASFRFGFAPVECTAIRLVATKLDLTNTAGDNYALIISDMRVYGDNATREAVRPDTSRIWGNQAPAAVVLSRGTDNELLNDGDRTSPENTYTSELVDSADGIVSMQFIFDRPTRMDRIHFYPVGGDTADTKFPTAFEVYAYTGSQWELIRSVSNYTSTYKQEFSFREICCSSIIIRMTGLYQVDGRYGVQLKDIDLMGAIGSDTGVVLGDGSGDDKLTEADLPYIRQGLLKAENTSKYDFNMDYAEDVRDLVRAKNYFTVKQ